MGYFKFKNGTRMVDVHDSIKDMSYEEIEKTWKGKLDYVSLAKQLGKKPASKKKVVKED